MVVESDSTDSSANWRPSDDGSPPPASHSVAEAHQTLAPAPASNRTNGPEIGAARPAEGLTIELAAERAKSEALRAKLQRSEIERMFWMTRAENALADAAEARATAPPPQPGAWAGAEPVPGAPPPIETIAERRVANVLLDEGSVRPAEPEQVRALLKDATDRLKEGLTSGSVDVAAIPPYQRELIVSGAGLLPFEVDLVADLAANLKQGARIVELGSGIGLLPLALTLLGYDAAGIEPLPGRRSAASHLQHAFLDELARAGVALQFLDGSGPNGVPELDHDVLVVSNFFTQQAAPLGPWFELLRRFPLSVLNLGRFVERRPNKSQQVELLEALEDSGFSVVRTLSSDPSDLSAFIFVTPDPSVFRP